MVFVTHWISLFTFASIAEYLWPTTDNKCEESIENDARKKDRELQRQNESASIIQRAWWKLKSKLMRKRKELEFKNESASIIQRAWWKFKSKLMRKREELEFKNKCAERIQKAFRRRKLKIERREELKLKIRAVGLLQKAWRERRTKRRMCRKRKGEKTSMYPDKIPRVESLWSVDDRDFKYLVKVQKLGEGGFGELTETALALELVTGGDLAGVLKAEGGRVSEQRARCYAVDIGQGLKYLYSKNVIHRDIKPANILVTSNGHLKLSDFGLSEVVAFTVTGTCGTFAYMAPEMIIGEPYTYSVDWWSFGVTLFQMLTGQLPFYDDEERNLFENIVYTTPDIPDWLGTEARDCLLKLLRKCPAVRLGVYNYHLHPFFSGKEPLAITCGSSAPNATAENKINPMSGFSFLLSDEEDVFMADDTSSD
ncbi:cAMP-dependent protein kinase catalytic subunit-like [Stylophora pistillata]|uniref:cAMP-dependent protein kinase catalytic subunit-like n=1 Tax=Stylophora pistillata TaxID=50429 RepID=UPI000C03C86D|nr:cAMP-dependent protein kinase catalytic subunit-like [Stylophora pistillata]